MVMATATGRTAISVQWERVDCIERNSDITGYMVSYGQRGNGDSETRTVMGTADRTYTVMGLNASTEYFVMVAAMNSDGATGPFSNPVFIETPSKWDIHVHVYIHTCLSVDLHTSFVIFCTQEAAVEKDLTCHCPGKHAAMAIAKVIK